MSKKWYDLSNLKVKKLDPKSFLAPFASEDTEKRWPSMNEEAAITRH